LYDVSRQHLKSLRELERFCHERKKAEIKRVTKGRSLVKLCLDGSGASKKRRNRLFKSMIFAAGFSCKFDLELSCEGDLIIDDHHSAEDCAMP
jgi:imidazoleglycerol phosphate dehydratase HisB